MKVETQDLEDRQVQLTIEVPVDRFKTAMRSAAKRLSKASRIPGFRPGKVPYEVAVGRFGEETVFQEALDHLGQELYRQALEDSDLEPIAPGILDEVVSREPLTLRYRVPLTPEVELGDYKKLRLDFEVPEVGDEAVDAVMEDLRQRRALIEPADRPSQLSDVIVVDVRGELTEPEGDDDPLILEEKEVSLLLGPENDWPIPDIAQHLEGIAAGEERTVSHTFADDYANESLRGQEASFHFRCQEVKSRLVPEWSDDLAQSMGDYESLLDLRIKVRESLTESAGREAEADYAEKAIQALLESASLNYPPVLLESEQQELVEDLERRLRSQNLDLQTYLKAENQTPEELLEELKPRAKNRLERALVLGKLVDEEQIEVEDQEVEQRIQSMSRTLGDANLQQALQSDTARRRIRNDLLVDKAVERLVGLAKGETEFAEKTSEE